jgi:hypothetical protein
VCSLCFTRPRPCAQIFAQAIAIVTTIVVWKIVHSQNDQNAPFVGGPMLEKELSRHASSLPPRGVEPPNSNSHTERGERTLIVALWSDNPKMTPAIDVQTMQARVKPAC